MTSAPTPSRSTQRAWPRPMAPNAERIVASMRSSVSTAANLFAERAPQRLVCRLAVVLGDLLAQQAAGEGDRAAVAAHVDACAHAPRTADLEPRRHLVLGLEAAHQASADEFCVRAPLQCVPAALELVERDRQLVEALVRDLPANAGGQRVAGHPLSACLRCWRSASGPGTTGAACRPAGRRRRRSGRTRC